MEQLIDKNQEPRVSKSGGLFQVNAIFFFFANVFCLRFNITTMIFT